MLALVWGCGSSSTVTPVDGGKGDAKSDAADGHVDSGPEGDTGALDSTMGDTAMGDTAMGDTSTGDTSPADTSTGDTSPPPDAADTAPATFTVGGTISGTMGETVTLQNNMGDNLAVSANGSFTFTTPLASGAAFNVTVFNEPANLNCTVMSGTGTIANGNVTSVLVNCVGVAVDGGTDTGTIDSGTMEAAAGTVFIGGTVTGLSGTLVLNDNGGNPLTVNSNGSFTFSQTVATGSPYAVTVATQPATPVQVCTVTMGSGTAPASNVTSVAVNCVTTTFTVGVTISGLSGTIVLQDNSGDNLSETANGSYTFATPVASGAPYSVTVLTQPALQTCVVGATGTGTIGNANVTGITVTCGTPTFTVGGTISGLPAGQSIVLNDNGGDADTVSASGGFTFATALANGAAYAVTIKTQPAGAVCTLSGATGTISGANVTSVVVNCASGTFTVGGTITGLAPGDSVQLEDNGGNSSFFSGNGSFAFSTALPSGGAYAVTVQANPAQPTAQTCTVTNGTGTVGSANVTSVAINCVTNTYTVSGKVVLLNTGADVITLTDNLLNPFVIPANSASPASFTFSQAVPSSSPFNVVGTATGPVTLAIGGVPGMSCFPLTVGQTNNGVTATSNAAGVVGNVNVSGIVLVCQAAQITVSARAVGLGAGDSIQLNLNGGGAGNTVGLNSVNPGPTAFGNTINSGTVYNVTLVANPTAPIAQTCVLGGNASGTAGGANFTVTVTCTTNNFTFTANVMGATGALFQLVNSDATAGNGQLCPASIVCTAADTPSPCCLQNNGSVSLGSMASGTAFAFQPINTPGAICSVTPNPASPVGNAVVNLNVLCDPAPQTLSVNYTNLDGLITLSDVGSPVGGDGQITVTGNSGALPAPTGENFGPQLGWTVDSNATYNISIVPGACGQSVCFTGAGTANQDCTLSNASGTTGNTVGGGVSNIGVNCTTNNFTLSGQINNLEAATANVLVLQTNEVDTQPTADHNGNQTFPAGPAAFNGNFSFGASIPSGSTYAVTFSGYPQCGAPPFTNGYPCVNAGATALLLPGSGAQPACGGGFCNGAGGPAANAEVCTLTQANGTIGNGNIAAANGPIVDCAPLYSMTINYVNYQANGQLQQTDLIGNDGLGASFAINFFGLPGGVTAPTFQPVGSSYTLSVPTYASLSNGQASNPIQNCTFSNGLYSIGGTYTAAGDQIQVMTCVTEPLNTISVTVTGLASENSITLTDTFSNNTATLQNNNLILTGAGNQNAAVPFSATVATGQRYAVTIGAQANPVIQSCAFTAGATSSPAMTTGNISLTLVCNPPIGNGTSCTTNNQCGSQNCSAAFGNLCEPNAGTTAGTPCDGTCNGGLTCDMSPTSGTYLTCQ